MYYCRGIFFLKIEAKGGGGRSPSVTPSLRGYVATNTAKPEIGGSGGVWEGVWGP